MAFLRIVWKSFKLSYRSKRRFLIAVLMYASLIVTTSYIINFVLVFLASRPVFTPSELSLAGGLFGIAALLLFITLVLSVIYSLIISGYRKREVATLRTIGWDMGSIRTFFMSELVFVFIVAFVLVVEIIIHILGITQYFGGLIGYYYVAINPGVLGTVFGIVLTCQILAILFGYWRMLKVRPMEAMRKA